MCRPSCELRLAFSPHRTRPGLGSSAPVFDAVVVGCEAVVDAP